MDFLLDLANPWGYVLVGLLALAEGAALVGLFLPGETAMLLGGVLVYQGRASLAPMLLIACAGAVVGDSAGFWLGRRFGARIRSSRLGRRVGDERWESAGRYLRERGGKAVFFARFLGFLRTLVPPLAGSSGMPYRRFVVFNAPAAILWTASFVVLGVAAGRSWEAVDQWAGRAGVVLLLLAGIGLVLFFAARWVQRRERLLRRRWRAFLDDDSVRRLRARFRPQIDFLQRRLDPAERFGLYLTAGLAVALVAAAGFAAILDSLAERGDVLRLDAAVLEFFSDHDTPRLDRPMEIVAGAAGTRWIAAAICFVGTVAYATTRKWEWVLLTVALLAGGLFLDDLVRGLLEVLGVMFGRVRGHATGGFPSGEATVAGAFVAQLAYVAARTRSWRAAVWSTAVALFVAVVVAVAVVYLARQAPSALLGGFLLGLFWAGISVVGSYRPPRTE